MAGTLESNHADALRVGIDIGGTFTDLTVLGADGLPRLSVKTPTISGDPSQGVADALSVLEAGGLRLDHVRYFVHGTTIALNSVIERTGARTALIVTDGFRDLLELGRLRLPSPFSFYSRRPTPLIPRKAVVTARERVRHDGSVALALTDTEAERVAAAVTALDVEGVAVCLMHAYANPVHEERLAAALARSDASLSISTSAEVWPEIREYERALVTVLNAYIRPPMERYVDGLHAILAKTGVGCAPYLTRSNGGVTRASTASAQAVQTLLSGPAAGVVGATNLARRAGLSNLITFDMGGTSADISVVQDGEIGYSRDEHIGDFSVVVPAIAISSIGAGGGSLISTDPTGVMKVGPESAGADPGPACYGLGATQPAVTDAFLLSGYLDPEGFAGKKSLDTGAARAAMAAVATKLGRDIDDVTSAALDVAVANMYLDFSATVERRGIDPRDFTLVAFGGAGPVIACLLGEEVNIEHVLFPLAPGTLCALGALEADVMADFVRTANWRTATLAADTIRSLIAELRAQATGWLEEEAPPGADVFVSLAADMRYLGQSYELDVPLPRPEDDIAALQRSFHDRHQRVFSYSDRHAQTEIVNVRARARAWLPRPVEQVPSVEDRGKAVPRSTRPILLRGERLDAALHRREDLEPGHLLAGPAVVWQADTTLLLPDGWRAAVGAHGNILAERNR